MNSNKLRNSNSSYLISKKITSVFLSFIFFYTQTAYSQNAPIYTTTEQPSVMTVDSNSPQLSMTSAQNNSNYSGSQANDKQSLLKEDINEKTGDVNLKYPLVDLSIPGLNFNLDLNLTYNTASNQYAGSNSLPAGWSFDLPYLDLTNPSNAIVHFNGSSYTEDPLWSDTENYYSGLRYVNTHGVKFQRFLNQQKLDLDEQNTVYYNFSLKFVDGSEAYFDAYGRPIVKTNRFNVYLLYSYFDNGSFYTSKIKEIRNSLYTNQRISFLYSSDSITIVNPNSSSTKLFISGNNLVKIENALGEQVSFQYNIPTLPNFVTSINYPNGLNSIFKYEKFLPIKNCGAESINKPVISEFIHTDSTQNNSVLNQTFYKYSSNSLTNYSGYPSTAMCPKSELDMLMESNNFDFKYDISVIKSGNILALSENGKNILNKKLITSTKTVYNFLHLPIHIETYSSQAQDSKPYYITDIEYKLTRDIHKMTPAFAYPISKTTLVIDENTDKYVPFAHTEYKSDAFGNNTLTTEFKFSYEAQKWLPVSSKSTQYYNDPDANYSLPKKENTFDYITNLTYETQFLRTADRKEIATKTVGILNSQGNFVPSIAYTHNYDEFGRSVLEKTECLDTSENMCKGNIKEFFTSTSYELDSTHQFLQVKTTDPEKHVWIKNIDTSIGKEISSISPSGKVMTSYTYDKLGRVLSETTPGLNENEFNTKTYSYKSFQNAGINEVSETDNATLLTLTKVYDALDREVEKYDNFYPELSTDSGNQKSISPENKRILSSSEYNSYGLLNSETDQFGQKTLTSYDSLGRKNGTIDNFQNVKETKIDDTNRTETTYFNGAKIAVVVKDFQDNTIESTIIPNEAFKCNAFLYNYCSNISANQYSIKVQKSLFDAQKREIKKEELFYDNNGNFLNKSTVEMNYNLLNKVNTTSVIGYDGINSERKQFYDIFGNVVYFTKQRSENGTKLALFTSDKYFYNVLNKLENITRQDGKVESYTYNDDGILVGKVSYSGVTHNYTYFNNYNLKSETISRQSINIENFSLNMKEKLRVYFNIMFTSSSNEKTLSSSPEKSSWEKDFSSAKNFNGISYTYNKQNSLTGVTYTTNDTADLAKNVTYNYLADGTTLKYIAYANGNTQTTSYDHYGRVFTNKDFSGNITTYFYDVKNNHPERLLSAESLKNKQRVVYDYYKDYEENELGAFGALKSTQNYVNDTLLSSSVSIADPLFRELLTIQLNNLGNVVQKRTNVFDAYSHIAKVLYESDIDATDSANYSLKYVYDSSNTLIGFQKINKAGSKLYEETYSLDSNYNVLERNIFVGGTLANKMQYQYNDLNQLISYTSSQSSKPFELSYDTDGRMISDDLGNTYSYQNFSDKITEIKNKSNVVVAQYTYYPTGNRMAKMVFASNAGPTEFYYNNDGSVSTETQKSSSGYSFASYLFENKNIKSSRILSTSKEDSTSDTQFYINNAKNTDKTFGQNNSLIESLQTYFYSPYGEVLDAQGQSQATKPYTFTDNPYGYENSRITDTESGLILLDARYYNPRLMRFMSLDSYNVDNKYSYGNGDPIGNADPSGHMAETNTASNIAWAAVSIVASIIGIIVSAITLQEQFTAILAGAALKASQVFTIIAGVSGVAGAALGIASAFTHDNASFGLAIASMVFGFVSILSSNVGAFTWYKVQPNLPGAIATAESPANESFVVRIGKYFRGVVTDIRNTGPNARKLVANIRSQPYGYTLKATAMASGIALRNAASTVTYNSYEVMQNAR